MEYPKVVVKKNADGNTITIDEDRLIKVHSATDADGFVLENGKGCIFIRSSSPNGLNGKAIYLPSSIDWVLVNDDDTTCLVPLMKDTDNA